MRSLASEHAGARRRPERIEPGDQDAAIEKTSVTLKLAPVELR